MGNTYCATEKGKEIPYTPLYGVFSSFHNASDLSLLSFWRHVSTTNFCTFHFMLLGNGEGKYENLQETFNSVKKVYQGLQLPYVFSLILSLLSFPYDLWYSKQLTVFEECPNREVTGTASCPCSSHASLGTCLGPAFCWHHPAAGWMHCDKTVLFTC